MVTALLVVIALIGVLALVALASRGVSAVARKRRSKADPRRFTDR